MNASNMLIALKMFIDCVFRFRSSVLGLFIVCNTKGSLIVLDLFE
jgi:hypothetical protein